MFQLLKDSRQLHLHLSDRLLAELLDCPLEAQLAVRNNNCSEELRVRDVLTLIIAISKHDEGLTLDVGTFVGREVGSGVCTFVGGFDGAWVGFEVGSGVGAAVVGSGVCTFVGGFEGGLEGTGVGSGVGGDVGLGVVGWN